MDIVFDISAKALACGSAVLALRKWGFNDATVGAGGLITYTQSIDGEPYAVRLTVEVVPPCEFTQSHTRSFCGNPGCRES